MDEILYSRKLMPDKDPSNIPLLTYGWVIGMAALGGVASYFKKLKDGHVRVFSVCEFVGELVVSAFAGIITFFICQHAGIDGVTSAAFVGIAGHMGSKAIMLIEKLFVDKIK
jgi:hypothetical protein